jgi:FRG domain
MRFKERRIKSIGELVSALLQHRVAGALTWYRGHTKSDWPLRPSLARITGHAEAEIALLKRFQQNAMPHLSRIPQEEWEWLFLMQHHRVPTRLLDWTESPLAALYFAVEELDDNDGALWCLNPVALNAHANVSFQFALEVPAFGHDQIMDNYLPTKIASETTSQLSPIAAIGPRNSPRIAAQLGVFTITHRTHGSIEEVGDQKHIWKYIIPSAAKSRLRRELTALRYTRLTLFPELDSVALAAREVLP